MHTCTHADRDPSSSFSFFFVLFLFSIVSPSFFGLFPAVSLPPSPPLPPLLFCFSVYLPSAGERGEGRRERGVRRRYFCHGVFSLHFLCVCVRGVSVCSTSERTRVCVCLCMHVCAAATTTASARTRVDTIHIYKKDNSRQEKGKHMYVRTHAKHAQSRMRRTCYDATRIEGGKKAILTTHTGNACTLRTCTRPSLC